MYNRGLALVDVVAISAIASIIVALAVPVGFSSKDQALIHGCMNNLRTLSAATLLYAQDWDKTHPIAIPQDQYGRNQESFWGIPAERPGNGVKPSNASMALRRSFWSNAIFPYVGTWSAFQNAAPVRNLFPSGIRPTDMPNMPSSSYAPNVYLNSYPVAAVAQPSTTALFFQGMGRMSTLGIAHAYPPIVADQLPAPYRFARRSGGCPVGLQIYAGQASARVFGGGHTMAYADGSVDFVLTPSARSPWASLDSRGVPTSIWVSNVPGQPEWCANRIYLSHAPDIERQW